MTELRVRRDRFFLEDADVSPKTAIEFLTNNVLGTEFSSFMENQFGLIPEVTTNAFAQRHRWTLQYNYFGRPICTVYPEGDHFIVLFVVDKKEGKVITALRSALSPYVRTLFADTCTSPIGKCLLIQVTSARTLTDVKKLVRINLRPKIGIKETSHRFFGVLPTAFENVPNHEKMIFRAAYAL